MVNRTGPQVGVFKVYHIYAIDAVVTSGNLAEVLLYLCKEVWRLGDWL